MAVVVGGERGVDGLKALVWVMPSEITRRVENFIVASEAFLFDLFYMNLGGRH